MESELPGAAKINDFNIGDNQVANITTGEGKTLLSVPEGWNCQSTITPIKYIYRFSQITGGFINSATIRVGSDQNLKSGKVEELIRMKVSETDIITLNEGGMISSIVMYPDKGYTEIQYYGNFTLIGTGDVKLQVLPFL